MLSLAIIRGFFMTVSSSVSSDGLLVKTGGYGALGRYSPINARGRPKNPYRFGGEDVSTEVKKPTCHCPYYTGKGEVTDLSIVSSVFKLRLLYHGDNLDPVVGDPLS